MFYFFYGSYTKISMIFGSTQDLLHKFKHSAFLNKKRKRKSALCRAGGLLGLGPRRPASSPASRAGAACLTQPLTGGPRSSGSPPLSSLRDADRTTPPVSFVPFTRDDTAAAPAADSEVLGPRVRAHQLRLTFASRLLPLTRALPPSLYLNRITGGRPP